MSLRARLIVGLLALAAVGLLALAAVTYAEQRNFLYDRVDDQTKAAVGIGERGAVGALGGAPEGGLGGGSASQRPARAPRRRARPGRGPAGRHVVVPARRVGQRA